MTDKQVRQAVETYLRAYDTQFWQRYGQQPWAPLPSEPGPQTASAPTRQSQTSLAPAQDVDKAGAIEVEFVRVR